LIEILVVLAIIGILAGVILTRMSTARTRARDAAFKTTASSIGSAAAMCCNSSGDPVLNAADPNTGNIDICFFPDINSRYPDKTQIDKVVVDIVCTNNHFSIILTPGTSNSGNCTEAVCTEEGCTYTGVGC